MVLTTDQIAAIQTARANIVALEAKRTKLVATADSAIGKRNSAIADIQVQLNSNLADIEARLKAQQAIIDSAAEDV